MERRKLVVALYGNASWCGLQRRVLKCCGVRKLFPAFYFGKETAIESSVARAKPSNTDEFPGLGNVSLENILGNGFIKDQHGCLSFPFVNDRECARNASAACALTVRMAHVCLRFSYVFVDPQHDEVRAKNACRKTLGPCGVAFAWNLFPEILRHFHQAVFECHRRDVKLSCVLFEMLLKPPSSEIGRAHV